MFWLAAGLVIALLAVAGGMGAAARRVDDELRPDYTEPDRERMLTLRGEKR